MVQHSSKLTSNAGESDIASLLGNGSVFVIPFFQRPYKWTPARLSQLHSDVMQLTEEISDLHFLGAIIVHGLPSNPAEPKLYEVIDGQQRITTLYLHICAAVKTLIIAGELDEAESLFRRYIVTSVAKRGSSNVTLQPCKEDRSDLNSVIRDILDTKGFASHLEGFTFRPLNGQALQRGRISHNYDIILRFYREALLKTGVDHVRRIYSCVLQRMSVVQIDVQDPTNGPKIFDSLNSRQEPMTIGDLVRNDVFTRVALTDPDTASDIEEHQWQPFYRKFDASDSKTKRSLFDDYFFPYGLIDSPNLKKSQAYLELKQRWAGMSPDQIIASLTTYQDAFLDLVRGSNLSNHPKSLSDRFRRFHSLGAPSSTYPFLMKLSAELGSGSVPVRIGEQILDAIESFLVRRALVGIEPTGLHAVFKRLWIDCDDDLSAERVIAEIRKHKTVRWPNDQELIDAILNRPLYGTSIAQFAILEYNASLGGDIPSDIPWIEHILPSTQSESWSHFSVDQHRQVKDLFANLIPLTSRMNQSLSNSGYAVKRPIYASDSLFKAARLVAEEFPEWTIDSIHARGNAIANWAVSRWGV